MLSEFSKTGCPNTITLHKNLVIYTITEASIRLFWYLQFFMLCTKRLTFLTFDHIPDMVTIPHLCLQHLNEIRKARKGSVYIRPYLSLSLFITTISICAILCPYVNYMAKAQNAPSVIHIGALVSYETFIGRAAVKAIQMALNDINKDKIRLNTSVLVLHLLDTNCSAFTGVAAAMQLFKQEVVAVIGPQSTAVARFVAHMATATQVPLLSFGVTDRSFSEHQYPYFFRIAHSDALQMQAIASLIARYGWRDAVIVYIDDEYGSSAVAALSDAVQPLGVHLVEKVAVIPDSDNSSISGTLTYLSSLQPRVFVVHLPQNLSLLFFAQAKNQRMLSSGYVWIASDLMFSTLNFTALETSVFSTLQGVIGFRGYVPKSSELQTFISEWNNQSASKESEDNTIIYSLYAYDATQMLAHAIDRYMRDGFNITFKDSTFPSLAAGGSSDLAQIKVFEGGPLLSSSILRTQFPGASGYVQLNSNGDLNRTAFEILNIVDQEFKVVGYWTNETQLSVSPPVNVSEPGFAKSQSSALPIKWPGDLQETPRGWVLPKNGRPLKIAVPRKIGFEQFLSYSVDNVTNETTYSGYCIDVFLEALSYVPYTVPYKFELFGNESGPIYDDMIFELAHKSFDAVVGDVTITTKRMEIVDFTQSIKDSGLVVVVPVQDTHTSYPWAFLRPFSPAMWCTTLAFFVFTGIVVWLLEHKKNRDFQGNPRKQVVTFLWFTFSTLFFSQRERTKSTYGRVVVLIWLFVVLIITSSYTANLTSILTIHQLTPVVKGISSLQTGTDSIGYQTGSFVKNYLINMNIASDRLIAMDSINQYAEALRKGPDNGGVAAVVEELPYVEVFLSTICGFTIVGDQFTKGGWGFAFPKGSQLAVDMSTAILNISENGQLRKIQDRWLTSGKCAATSNDIESIQLSLGSFWGLFLVTGTASALSLVIYLSRLLLQFSRLQNDVSESTRPAPKKKGFIKSFASYVNESGVVKSKKKESTGGGKNKKNVDYQLDQNPSSQQYQGSPSSQSSLFSQSPEFSLSSPSYLMFPSCQSSPSYQSSPSDQSPHHADNS